MKKLFTLLMTLWLAIGSLFAVDFKGGEVLYLTPCDNWITNAKNNGGGKPGRYAAYFFGNGDKWIAMTAVAGETELYQVTAPAGFKQVIFCAMNPTSTGLSWNDKWNQTNDLSYDGKNNHYTVKKGTWDKGGGTWSYYCTAPTITIVSTPEFPATTVDETSISNAKYTLECSEDKPEISIDNDAFTAVDADGTITITFAPTEAKEYTATLTIAVGEEKETIELAATGLAKDVVKDPEVLNLTAPAFTAIVEGNTTTAVATYELLNADEAEAKVEGEGFEITEQEVGKVTIQFAPTKAGEYAGTLLVLVAGETLKEVAFTATAKPSPYYAIRGSMTDWSDKNDIKMTANEDKSEYSIKEFEIASGDEFKVVYVNEENVTTWYGVSSVEKNPEIGNNIGSDNIVLPAGKYDIYYKVKESKIWIQKYVAPEEPKPSLTVSTEEVAFDEVELGEEPVVVTETITYTVENSEDTPVIELESDVFTAEDAEGTITITFAPEEEGEYTAELTITLGEIVKTVAISGSAKAAEIVEPEEPKINIIVSDFERNTAEVGDETDAAVVYSLENIESAEVEIEGEYVTFEQTEVEEGFMIAVFFRPEEVGEFPGKLTITAGEISEEIEFTFIATEPEEEPEYPKTITVKVACAWEACNIWAWYADGSGNVYTEWPGEAMTKGEDGFYAIDMTIESPVYFKVNAGLGKTESDNYMTELSESTCFNMDGLKLVVNEDCEYEEPIEIEPYYGIRGLVSWEMADDIKLTEDADKAEWYITNQEVDGTQEFKVVYVDKTGAATWYGSEAVELQEGVVNNGTDNIILAAGKYDIYFKANDGMMWIQFSADTPTDVEDAAAELIYSIDGTIIAPAPFAIIDLSGKDVTNANGSLQGTYIVKTQNSTAKISVK